MAALFNSLNPADSELRFHLIVCRGPRQTWIGTKTLDSFPAWSSLQSMFLALDKFRDLFAEETRGQTYSPPYIPSLSCLSVRCCSGWVRERSCLLWRWSENRAIPASSPTLRKEPLHRCSPKVNEALWFCGSSVFLNEALS